MSFQPIQEPFVALRTKALESLLIEKGLVTAEDIDRQIAYYEHEIGPMTGARIVARAWTDPDYRKLLLEDGSRGVAQFGVPLESRMVVVANEPGLHNMVVCTLCSCYPWLVLGLPPAWYKSFAYRSRAVIEPRAVLREFGLELEEDATIHVWDSSAEERYMVLPERPSDTEDLSEADLAALVSRDAMIGVARVTTTPVRPVESNG
jgi:nitrile hydratase